METFNEIARYAEGEMTTDERAAFETVLASDESLRKQLALYQEVHVSLQQHFNGSDQRIPLQDGEVIREIQVIRIRHAA